MLWPSHDGDHDGDPQSATGHTHTDARGSVWAAGPSSGRAGGSYLPAPAVRPRPAAAPTTEGFAHLFAAKTAEPVAKDKDQSLKSLLERIATCR